MTIHGPGYPRSFLCLAQMKVGSLLPLIGATAESIQRNRFCLMMSKGKEGIAHAANQDGNRRHQHEWEEANASYGGACEVVRGTRARLEEEVYVNEYAEIDFLMAHEDNDFACSTFVHKEVAIE